MNKQRQILVTVTYNELGCIIDTKAEERKKGKWIHGRERSREYIGDVCTNINYEDWHCSECGYVIERLQPAWNYCPNCGALMSESLKVHEIGKSLVDGIQAGIKGEKDE